MSQALLNQTIREIKRAMDAQQRLSPRMCWRLHPKDWHYVRDAAVEYAKEAGDQEQVIGTLILLGVPVFCDATAPRLAAHER